MVRIQLHLTDDQDRRLRALARERGTTRAELIRRGVDRVLGEADRSEDSLLELIGAARDPGAPDDASERHDELIYGMGEPLPLPAVADRPPRRK